MAWKRSERPVRQPHDVEHSKNLKIFLDAHDPTEDPAGWQISDTGTVWTEIVAHVATDRERRTQVIAITPYLLLLVVPIGDVAGLATVEEFWTLAGAEAYWEDRSV